MTLPLAKTIRPWRRSPQPSFPPGRTGSTSPSGTAFVVSPFATPTHIDLESKSGKPLTRYFPELVAALAALKPHEFVLDGEIVIPVDGDISFDDLLMRIHPAESRIHKLSQETPGVSIVFDLLADEDGNRWWTNRSNGRDPLEKFAKKYWKEQKGIRLSPARKTCPSRANGSTWESALDGMVAKRPTSLPERQRDRHAEDQEAAHRRLRGRRVSLSRKKEAGGFAFTRSLQQGRQIARSRRLYIVDQRRRSSAPR